jgi:tryptophan 2,3-dioxygenase
MDKKLKLESVISELKEKHEALSQDTNLFLEGFLHSKQLTYWDYINTDALLNLQIQ